MDDFPVTAPRDDEYIEPTHLPFIPGERFTILAISVDDDHLGHCVDGVAADGTVFRGQLRRIRRYAVEDRMVFLVNHATVEVHLDANVRITVGRSMPADPWTRLQAGLARGKR